MNVYALIANVNATANVTSEQAKGFPLANGARGVSSLTGMVQQSDTPFAMLLQQQFSQLADDSVQPSLLEAEASALDIEIEQLLMKEQWNEDDWNLLAQWLQTMFVQHDTAANAQSGIQAEGEDTSTHPFDRLASAILTQWAKLSGQQSNDANMNNQSPQLSFVSTVKQLIPQWQQMMADADSTETDLPLARLLQAMTATLEDADVRFIHADEKQVRGANVVEDNTVQNKRSDWNPMLLTNVVNRQATSASATISETEPLALHRMEPAFAQWTTGRVAQAETEANELKMTDFVRISSLQTTAFAQQGETTDNQSLPASQQANNSGENTVMSEVAFKLVDESKGSTVSETQPKPNVPTTMQAQNFAEEMGRMLLKKWQTSSLNGVSEARIQLVPEHLGQLDVHIKIQNGQLTAQFMADKLLGKEMIESQIALLRNALVNQGLQVDKIEVTHQPMHHGGAFQEQSQHQSFKNNKQSARKDVTAYSIGEQLPEDNDLSGRRLAHGGVFDVTA